MKSRHIILVAISVIAVTLGVMFFLALKNHNSEVSKIEHIPDILLTTIDGEEFLLTGLSTNYRTAILFFSTDCEFCRKEIEGILASRDSFKDTNWVFVTVSSEEDLEEFLTEYPLTEIEKSKVCILGSPELLMSLDLTSPPSLFIYSTDGNLEHYNRGAVSIQTILEWLS